MGGTFDPPHNGHFRIAADVADAKELDHVVFMPAAQPWQKSRYSDAEDRFAMTELGARSDPRFVVSRIELDRPGPTYTIDTMSTLSARYPKVELWLIVGADAALNLKTWHRSEELMHTTNIIVVRRPGFDLSALDKLGLRSQPDVVEAALVDISSTEIRAAVREGRSIEQWVPPQVAGYIAAHHLYRDGGRAA